MTATQLPLFAYPSGPGYKVRGTSSTAAATVESHAANLRQRVYSALQRRPMTADEVAEALGESILGVRPRVSELARDGKVRKTEERRVNRSGMSANVWEVRG